MPRENCAKACGTNVGKKALDQGRYADNCASSIRSEHKDRGESKQNFLDVSDDMIRGCSSFGFQLK